MVDEMEMRPIFAVPQAFGVSPPGFPLRSFVLDGEVGAKIAAMTPAGASCLAAP
jgi:hypothetical protein